MATHQRRHRGFDVIMKLKILSEMNFADRTYGAYNRYNPAINRVITAHSNQIYQYFQKKRKCEVDRPCNRDIFGGKTDKKHMCVIMGALHRYSVCIVFMFCARSQLSHPSLPSLVSPWPAARCAAATVSSSAFAATASLSANRKWK